VIEPASRLLQRSMPPEVSSFMLGLHRLHGVDMRLETTPVAINKTAEGGALIKTDRGDVAADVVVIGIGVLPNVELAVSAGLVVIRTHRSKRCSSSGPSRLRKPLRGEPNAYC
jgi:anthranilate 1,2-dioxygenase ferredoxin reductase subunit